MYNKSIETVTLRVLELEAILDKALVLGEAYRGVDNINDLLEFNRWLLKRLISPNVSRRLQ